MSKKKKKIRNMTEVDYANYIMSLKDERPAIAITPDVKNKDNDKNP
ncbi:MAG: hypothetical protein J5762_05680 [Clostridia bacterium]|nr:hypothetical protein [Clostridia bacterium]